MAERVHVEIRDEIAYVSLARPDKYNGLDLATFRALVDAAGQVERNREVRAVILSGEGKAFCAGLDFGAVGKRPAAMARAFAKLPGQSTNLFQRACWVWRELPVPVLAVLRGYCYGGGMQLALAADFRFSTPDCDFSIMEAKWGLIPDMTGSVTLRELVPMDVAKRLAMTAATFSGTQALEYGLVSEVSDDPLADAEAFAAELATRSPDSIAATKRLLHATWHRSPRSAFWTESMLQLRLMRGANHKIARAANLARELPRYVSRTLG